MLLFVPIFSHEDIMQALAEKQQFLVGLVQEKKKKL